jgi:hypothetical protein
VGREAHNSLASSAEVKNGGAIPLRFWCYALLIQRKENFTLLPLLLLLLLLLVGRY